jgi:transposase
MLAPLDGVDAQLGVLEHELAEVATREPYSDPVRWLCSFRGIAIKTALGLLAEFGDFRRFASARELMSYLGLTAPAAPPQKDRGQEAVSGAVHAACRCQQRPDGRRVDGVRHLEVSSLIRWFRLGLRGALPCDLLPRRG